MLELEGINRNDATNKDAYMLGSLHTTAIFDRKLLLLSSWFFAARPQQHIHA